MYKARIECSALKSKAYMESTRYLGTYLNFDNVVSDKMGGTKSFKRRFRKAFLYQARIWQPEGFPS